MQSTIGRWGNSLAIRLPVECARFAGLREGASVELQMTPSGELRITPAKQADNPGLLAMLKKARAGMPLTEPVVEALRAGARY